ncbi:hypothetical protein [Pukyongiella litopenaei]|uniref:Uncharacterized protein n=1 Tax=Pukyongiella litopenaei TaxID=2605946 RepID=A0A2S0MS09_9RHOB|nr:hypothetical protein [Pukyongiella litopenaei]AVO38531.2 hypothetical protein C6Y53_13085 [Pukyongiella litopenaei]
MSSLRDEIRAILREEISALMAEPRPAGPETEQVRIASSADLTGFAQDLVRRASDPDFAARVSRGEIVFRLAGAVPVPVSMPVPVVTGPPRAAPETVDKALITERDIAGLGNAARSLRISARSRLTPLARDEARRRGIRIERTER